LAATVTVLNVAAFEFTAVPAALMLLAEGGVNAAERPVSQGLAAEAQAAAGAAKAPAVVNIPDLPRAGSGLKVDFAAPVRDGANNVVREFQGPTLAHGFPDVVDNFAGSGKSFQLQDGATLHQVGGSYNGLDGRFEWIVDKGEVTHRMFVGGGTVNGVPIVP
jgi:hypothetical protein